MTQEVNPIANYLPLLIKGNFDELLNSFAGEPLLDDPQHGEIKGIDRFKQSVAASHEWLTQRRTRIENIATTKNNLRIIEECILHLVQEDKSIPLPVAIVADISAEKLTFVRIYHSMWPLLGEHQIRSPILPSYSDLPIPDVVGHYQDGLAKGDLEAVVRQFEPNGYFREPSGGEFIYQGLEEIQHLFGLMFSNDGGIPPEHCTVTDDGTRCAIEYNLSSWGRTTIPTQAGIAVYERGTSGLLAAARIYDDITPPITSE
jgi:hypothetical protein